LSPDALTAGASGAVFGCMAAVVVALRNRGVGILQSNIGMLLLINLILTFTVNGISIGGHLGGLAAGAVGGLALEHTNDAPAVGAVVVAVLAVALFGVGIAVA
jgi:membrane associated rhomboid family serine protease